MFVFPALLCVTLVAGVKCVLFLCTFRRVFFFGRVFDLLFVASWTRLGPLLDAARAAVRHPKGKERAHQKSEENMIRDFICLVFLVLAVAQRHVPNSAHPNTKLTNRGEDIGDFAHLVFGELVVLNSSSLAKPLLFDAGSVLCFLQVRTRLHTALRGDAVFSAEPSAKSPGEKELQQSGPRAQTLRRMCR